MVNNFNQNNLAHITLKGLMSLSSYLHQMRSHHTPGSHHVQKWPALVPYDMKHGFAQPEEVKSTALVLC